jgi:hypothetical protein
VHIAAGTGDYGRLFVIPSGAGGQSYDLVASVTTPGFGHTYDMATYPSALTVAGQSSSVAQTAVATPAPVAATPATNDQNGFASGALNGWHYLRDDSSGVMGMIG